jgi:tRNA A-37 threonylcarbamoyl transferase component Bud32
MQGISSSSKDPSKQYGSHSSYNNSSHHPMKHYPVKHHSGAAAAATSGYHNPREQRNDRDEVRNSMSYESRGTIVKNRSHDTATTAAFTSYAGSTSMSMDDGSIASEYGTEIIMPHSGRSVTGSYSRFKSTTPYSAHTFKAGSHTFTVDTKYSFTRVIGSGAYGVVISAHDTHLNTRVAIKMVPKAFQDEIDAKRILREIKLLKHLKHENIVGIVDMMPPMMRYVDDFTDVYIVSELMETDLYRIIYSKQSLSLDHAQYFIYQVLRALKYIHSANVLHRDLKPSNLLVNSNCDLKVCDFGLARGIYDNEQMRDSNKLLLTEYVVTRWYRAPEIMLACHEYDKPVDVWSTGCVLAELLARKPFFPGEDYIDQVSCRLSLHALSFLCMNNSHFATIVCIMYPAHSHYNKAWQASRGGSRLRHL